MKRIQLILLFLSFVGCSKVRECEFDVSLLSNTDEKGLYDIFYSNFTVLDTLKEFQFDYQKDEFEYNSKPRFEVIRFGPVTMDKYRGILIALVSDKQLIQYDIYFDSIDEWILPINNVSSSQRGFKRMDTEDFSTLSNFIDKSLGLKKYFKKRDTEIWKSDNQAIRNVIYNGGIRLTAYKTKPVESGIEFLFHSLDEKPEKDFKLGLSREQIRKEWDARDTIISLFSDSAREGLVANISLYGIPGLVLFDFFENKAIGINWLDNTLNTQGLVVNNRVYSKILFKLENQFGNSKAIPSEKFQKPTDRSNYWEMGNDILYLNLTNGEHLFLSKQDKNIFPFPEDLR